MSVVRALQEEDPSRWCVQRARGLRGAHRADLLAPRPAVRGTGNVPRTRHAQSPASRSALRNAYLHPLALATSSPVTTWWAAVNIHIHIQSSHVVATKTLYVSTVA